MTRIRHHAFQLHFLRCFLILFSLGLVVLLPEWAVLESSSLLLAQEKKSSPPPTRADLEALASESLVEITTTGRKSGKPRTSTIWFIYDKGRFYIQSGQRGKTSWYRNLKKNKRICIKIVDLTFIGMAQFIDDSAETERIHEMFRSKYLRARLAGWVGSDVGHGKVVEIALPF
jgi:deazaflavin-dependent oxidoreductase (nitroreductase family)